MSDSIQSYKNYVNLHAHSHFSLLDGFSKPDDMAKTCKEYGYRAASITDHGVISGCPIFFKECKKAGIKPILGIELYVCEGSAKDKSPQNRGLSHLVVLCKNLTGWKELIQLVSESNKVDHFYHKPRVDYEMMKQYLGNGNHIAISGHPGSTVADSLFVDNKCYRAKTEDEARTFLPENWFEVATESIKKHRDIFEDNFFIEIQLIDRNRLAMAGVLGECLREVAKHNGWRPVATADSHYVRRTDAVYQRILLCSSLGLTLPKVYADLRSGKDVPLGGFFQSDSYHIPTFDEMSALHTEEELSNSVFIAEQCEDYDILSKPKLPHFKCPDNKPEIQYFRELCREGWTKKIAGTPKVDKLEKQQVYVDRVNMELDVIERADLAGYSLIVWDIIEFLRKKGWMTPCGRGSAAGCLSSYLAGIVTVDAVRHDLLFERYYNEGRIGSLPDIDIDVPSAHREEVIQNIKDKYGEDYVSQMATFGALMGRSAIKEVLRAEGTASFAEVNEITEDIPDEAEIADELEEMEEKSIILWSLQNRPKKFVKWCTLNKDGSLSGPLADSFQKAIKIEGTYKSQGKHAAGIIISAEKISDLCPLIRDKDGKAVAGFNMHDLEALGLVKFDILGVNVMDKIDEIKPFLPYPEKMYDLDDPDVWRMLGEGDVKGIFQLELQKRWTKKLKPENIDHLSALIAIIRPGVVEAIEDGKSMTEHYVDRKNGKDSVPSIHPIVDDVLKSTYSVIVFQEQAMLLAKEVAGFDLKEADNLRKAIGKKLPELMAKMKIKFLEGAKKVNKVPEEIVIKLFDWIEASQRYSFNASHSYSYAYNGYYTAYCKYHAPLKFYEVYLNHANSKPDTIKEMKELINDAKLHGINVYGPALHRFNPKFTLNKDKNCITFGISNIKDVGAESKKLFKLKEEMGDKFGEMTWMELLVNTQNINKKAIRALICSGAFNGPKNLESRNAMLHEYEIFRGLTDKEANYIVANLEPNEDLLYHFTKLINNHKISKNRLKTVDGLRECIINPPSSTIDNGLWVAETERHYMGISLTGGETDGNMEMAAVTATCMDVRVGAVRDRQVIAGTIGGIKEYKIKKEGSKLFGQTMAFVTLEDSSGEFNSVVVFPDLYGPSRTMLVPGNYVMIGGKIESRNGEFSLITDSVNQL